MKRILTVQDISCVGQCSATVALPIVSACGVECCVLPTAVLSTHTGGFSGYTFLDLSEEMNKIVSHWKEEKITFDCIYTGYLGSIEQIEQVGEIIDTFASQNTKVVIDPVMADNGKLYVGFSEQYAKKMAQLIKKADIIVPNITEACFLLDLPYRQQCDKQFIQSLLDGFEKMGIENTVITGVSFEDDKLGFATRTKGETDYFFLPKIPVAMHGTGDVYASALVGAIMRGFSLFDGASLAAQFTVESIRQTLPDKEHWYGVMFEKAIPYLIEKLNCRPSSRSAANARIIKREKISARMGVDND